LHLFQINKDSFTLLLPHDKGSNIYSYLDIGDRITEAFSYTFSKYKYKDDIQYLSSSKDKLVKSLRPRWSCLSKCCHLSIQSRNEIENLTFSEEEISQTSLAGIFGANLFLW